jgi:hypothetical protein
MWTDQTPGDVRDLGIGGDKNLLLNLRVFIQLENPSRPWVGSESLDPLRTVTANNVRGVVLRAEIEPTGFGFDPRIEPIYQDHSAGGRPGCSYQQGVIAACANAGRGARSKAAESVGFEPFTRGHKGSHIV